MRLVLTSDPHADWSTYGVRRLEEVMTAMMQAAWFAAQPENGVDVFACLGDVANPEDGPEVVRAARLVLQVNERCGPRVRQWWLSGNHDVFKDGSGETTLSFLQQRRDVSLFERPAFVTCAGTEFAAAPPHPSLDFDLLALPYFAEGALGGDSLEDRLRVFAGQRRCERTLVLSHLCVEGVQPGEETTEMPRGREVLLPRALIGELFGDVRIFNGHYHRRQWFDPGDGAPGVQVVGTPVRITPAEERHEPGFLVVDLW